MSSMTQRQAYGCGSMRGNSSAGLLESRSMRQQPEKTAREVPVTAYFTFTDKFN